MPAEAPRGGERGGTAVRGGAPALEARGLTSAAGGRRILDDVSLDVRRGELLAIAGGSGAGKTTLLDALAGVRPAGRGTVRVAGADLYANPAAFRGRIGYVPQDDIIHAELPLRRTLRYAARLRLPASASTTGIDAAVDEVLAGLDLSSRADVPVAALSGGQRKRASIAVELLGRPQLLFLDEPTSGLDPATGAELLRVLRGLADRGTTVVLTTHAPQDLAACDRVAFLMSGGRLAFAGGAEAARRHFGVDRTEEIYERLADGVARPAAADVDGAGTGVSTTAPAVAPPAPAPRAGALRQWWVLTQRTGETLARNRLTVAIMLGSPALIVAMFAVLFRPGAFDVRAPDPSAIVMIIFWVAFGAFFFGLTYGLLQIVTERAVLRREAFVGQSLAAYLLAKVAVLLPFLVLVVVLMLGVLRLLDRLPAADAATYASLALTLTLDGAAALALGLLASALVANPSQATLALPMLCFPAVLFSGAILPVEAMARAGALISAVMPDRWAFEAVGRDLAVRELLSAGGSPLGPPLIAAYGDAGTAPVTTYWLYLGGFTLAFLAAAWAVLARRCRAGRGGRAAGRAGGRAGGSS